ncbi:hypothetical protein O0L34_g2600 [Tuta absoluta]|nr:hypothetical protein O0L34_g2600 [Tuta absoluta]
MELLESKWRMLGVHEVQEILPDCAGDDIDTIQFWSAVANLKTATGVTKLKELASFALRVLSWPISNAVVERAFSYMNTIKIKSRNRLNMDILQATMRIRIHLQVNKRCCHTFEPSDDMLLRFSSANMYENNDRHYDVQALIEIMDDIRD